MVEGLEEREDEVVFDEPFRFLCEVSSVEVLPVVENCVKVGRTPAASDLVDEVFDPVEESAREIRVIVERRLASGHLPGAIRSGGMDLPISRDYDGRVATGRPERSSSGRFGSDTR
jgi:hypothetical protein